MTANTPTAEAARWSRVKELFQQALQQRDPDAWIAAQCAADAQLLSEVRGLLAAQRGTQGILDHAAVDVLRRLSHAPADLAGTRIGAYHLLRLLGEGGMGSVYLAERDAGDFRQRVALKLVRADVLSGEGRARFLRERRILAQLVHPHIAQLHDGGVAGDGTPYFTLEYVAGEPITHYCDARRLGVPERLRLVLQVCAAVAYAHRNLIVHRDLKPSNIFVTAEGQAKLLDFGIAKLIDAPAGDGETKTQSRLMTPEYAAPEQVLGDSITTATDVYAIGVLLYELLSGRLPYARADAGSISLAKAVVEEAPEPVYRALGRTSTRGASAADSAASRGATLPTLRRTLRGDLDRIVQRALAKAPEARYATVGALAGDLGAYLDGRAISGGTRLYQVRKFARRYWLPLAATATILAIVLASAFALAWQARQIEREARNTLQVKDFLFGLFTAVDPHEARGRNISANELLDRGAERVHRDETLDAGQRAEIEGTLGRIYYQLGRYEQAQALQQSALRVHGDEPALQRQLAETFAARGELAHAEQLAAQATDALDAAGADPAERIRAWIARANVAQLQGKPALGEQYAERAVALARDPAIARELLGDALSAQGLIEWDLRNVPKSEALYREALQIHRAAFGDLDLRVATDRQDLTLALRNLGRYDEALQQARETLAVEEKILGAQHPDLSRALLSLGATLYHMAHYDEAERVLRRGVAVARASLGDNATTATALNNLGLVLMDWHGVDEAEQVFTEALRIYAAQPGSNQNNATIVASNLAHVHALQGKLEQAERELRELLARDRASGTKDQVWELDRLGEVRRERGDWREAVSLHREALQQASALFAPNSRQVALSHHDLGVALAAGGASDEAVQQLRAAQDAFRNLLPPDGAHPWAASTRLALGRLLLGTEATRAEALRFLHEAAAQRERFLGADDPRTGEARQALLTAQSAHP